MAGAHACKACRDGAGFETPITMAYQPIVDVTKRNVFAYEALVRGMNGEGAGEILDQVSAESLYAFDQTCRTTAISLATRLGLAKGDAYLSINFLPNGVYEPRACIRQTLAEAERSGFPANRIIFEFAESERINANHLLNILREYHAMGFKTAIDDFGSGYAGLLRLSQFQPDLVKIDLDLVRGIDKDSVKRAILQHALALLAELGIEVICEGVETAEEFHLLCDLGVTLMQGYFFARPAFQALPDIAWPA